MVSFAREMDRFDALEESVWRGMPETTAAFFVDSSLDARAFYLRGRMGNISGVAGVGAEAAAMRESEDENYRKRDAILYNTFANTASQTSLSQMLDTFFSRVFQAGLSDRAAEVANRLGIDIHDPEVRDSIRESVDTEMGGAKATILSAAPADATDIDGSTARIAEHNPAAVAALRNRLCLDLGGEEEEVCRAAPDEDFAALLIYGVSGTPTPQPAPAPRQAPALVR
ncbi:MAG: hypothetical protein AB7E85_00835 [Pseudobdellovibrionaceae bacterium]